MTHLEKTLKIMKQPWMITASLVLLVMVYIYIDIPLAVYMYQWKLRTQIAFLNILTFLGQESLYFILLPLAALFFRYIKKDEINEARCWYLFLCVVIASVVCCLLKITLGRARPELWFSLHAYGFYWFQINSLYWSLPSGHTTTVVSLASGLGLLFPKYFFAFLGLSGIIILTRITLYYHYLSDVLSAYYLTVLTIGIFTHYAKQHGYLSKILTRP